MGLRAILILAFFVVGMALMVLGWMKTGMMSGLLMMVVGLILLLAALMLYNKPYQG